MKLVFRALFGIGVVMGVFAVTEGSIEHRFFAGVILALVLLYGTINRLRR